MRRLTVCSNQKGFSLIEVMVSILLLSIGLLGNLAVTSFISKASAGTSYRGIAINMVSELQSVINSDFTSYSCYATTSTGTCTNTQGSDYFTEWNNRVAASLPGGVAPTVVFYKDANGQETLYTITLQWKLKQYANDPDLYISTYKLSSRMDTSL